MDEGEVVEWSGIPQPQGSTLYSFHFSQLEFTYAKILMFSQAYRRTTLLSANYKVA